MIIKKNIILFLIILLNCKTYQEKAIEEKFNPCPNYGNYNNDDYNLIPLSLIEGDKSKGSAVTIHFVNFKNEYRQADYQSFFKTDKIKTAIELREYLNSYKSICNKDFPPFYNTIPFVSKNISNLMKEKKSLINRNEEMEKEIERLSEIKMKEKEYVEAKNEIDKLFNAASDKIPTTYSIVGKVREINEDYVIIWGFAMPNGKSMMHDEGVIGVIDGAYVQINNFDKKNILYNQQYHSKTDYFTGKRGVFTSIKKDKHPDVVLYEKKNEKFNRKYEGFEIGLNNYETKKEELRINNHRLDTIATIEKDLSDLIPQEMRILGGKTILDVNAAKKNNSVFADVENTETNSNSDSLINKSSNANSFNDTVTLRNGITLKNVKATVTSDSLVVTDNAGKTNVYMKKEVSEVKKGIGSVTKNADNNNTDKSSGLDKWSSLLGAMTWHEAMAKCEEHGMRLPTIDDLLAGYTAKITDTWKKDSYDYWSSTTKGDKYSYSFMIDDGSSYVTKRTNKNFVRCIR